MATPTEKKVKREKKVPAEAVRLSGSMRVASPFCPHCGGDVRERPAPRLVAVDPRQTSFLDREE